MKTNATLAIILLTLASPVLGDGSLTCDRNDQYTTIGVIYVDDHLMNPSSHASNTFPAPYIYAETNMVAGLQREPPSHSPVAKPGDTSSSDGSGHCGYEPGEPDQWLF